MKEVLQNTDLLYGYVFDLHLLCGGYAYYSTFSSWDKSGEHGREFRSARETDSQDFARYLAAIKQKLLLVENEDDYNRWLRLRGWAIIPTDLTRSLMPQWLKSRQCLKSPYETFTDIEICSKNALSHYASPGKREKVLDRDGGLCLRCKRRPEDGVNLTMQHVRPFGKGGETTTRNLVTLCEECNNSLGMEIDYNLYKSAGLSYDLDLGILRGCSLTEKNMNVVLRLSANMMHTRCDVW